MKKETRRVFIGMRRVHVLPSIRASACPVACALLLRAPPPNRSRSALRVRWNYASKQGQGGWPSPSEVPELLRRSSRSADGWGRAGADTLSLESGDWLHCAHHRHPAEERAAHGHVTARPHVIEKATTPRNGDSSHRNDEVVVDQRQLDHLEQVHCLRAHAHARILCHSCCCAEAAQATQT